jgi:alkanesulfonate monooxygenase SsuD/methylene tetrahydromethanopterin reductase-like flavin-dependent oxidoreductase (luciferase family)
MCFSSAADISLRGTMIWFFTRGPAQIDVEVHRGPDPNAYTLAVTYPDGAERIERFDTAARLVTRALTIQQRLIDEGWMPTSPATGKPVPPRPDRKPTRFAATAARHARRALRRIGKVLRVFGF